MKIASREFYLARKSIDIHAYNDTGLEAPDGVIEAFSSDFVFDKGRG